MRIGLVKTAKIKSVPAVRLGKHVTDVRAEQDVVSLSAPESEFYAILLKHIVYTPITSSAIRKLK